MLWVHGVGFIFGEKSADDVVAFCDSFARRGYVTASVEYRLGFNPTSTKSAERAVYRGVQGLRATVRFMKENYDVYGIHQLYFCWWNERW
jgi:carboxylesterase type B